MERCYNLTASAMAVHCLGLRRRRALPTLPQDLGTRLFSRESSATISHWRESWRRLSPCHRSVTKSRTPIPILTGRSACFADYHMKTMEGLVNVCETFIYQLSTRQLLVCKMKQGGRTLCDAQMLGSRIFGLGRLNLWPLPESPSTLGMSVQEYLKDLKNIQFPAYRGPTTNHASCSSTTWYLAVEKVLTHSGPELLFSQKRHLDEQSKK